MSVALLPTSCRSFCSFSSDLLKTNRSTQVGTGKAWKGKTRGHQPFPKTILHSVYSWVVPALQITLELLKLDQFSFSIKRGLKFLLEALQGLTSITRKIRRSFNLSATLWYKRSYRPDFQEPPKDHMKILHGAFTRFFISSCMLASSSRACQLPQLDEVSKLRKNFKASRFVSSLACCLSAWKSLPVSDPLQSGAKILHFRPPSRVQSAAPAPEMHNVTHWKNRTVYFQLWQLLRVQRKNSSAKKKECHLISASMSSGSFCETLTPPCSDLCILFRKFHVVDAALHWG